MSNCGHGHKLVTQVNNHLFALGFSFSLPHMLLLI